MVPFEIGLLYEWMHAVLWPLCRVLALVHVAPVMGDAANSLRVRLRLAAATTVAVAPTLAPMPSLPTGSFAALWLTCQQVLIGIALGLVMRIVFAAVKAGGEIIGLQMGLSFASLFDPATGANTAVLSR